MESYHILPAFGQTFTLNLQRYLSFSYFIQLYVCKDENMFYNQTVSALETCCKMSVVSLMNPGMTYEYIINKI
jgi:hypothetical protein